jgi:type VI secretion system protein ImpJ
MALNNKIVWAEGTFLTPQHFQQQMSHIENFVLQSSDSMRPYNWGIYQLEFDQELLLMGKLSITHCQGRLPDGTPFNISPGNLPPPILEIPAHLKNVKIYLGAPLKQRGIPEFNLGDSTDTGKRYLVEECQVLDNTILSDETVLLQTGRLNLMLLTELDERTPYSTIEVARVIERRADDKIVLDGQFIPPCLSIAASARLSNFLAELLVLLHHRGESLAEKLAGNKQVDTIDELLDFMMLQLINRYEAICTDWCQNYHHHPQALFLLTSQLLGEMAVFNQESRRYAGNLQYDHSNLQTIFSTIIKDVRQALSMVLEHTAIALDLQERNYGVWVAALPDKTLLQQCSFVLAVKTNIAVEQMRNTLSSQIKVGSVEQIRELVNRALPGISLRPLTVIPRQIPFGIGYSYFELDKNSSVWQSLKESGGIAFHIGGDFLELKLELWAIRE